jgi:hypothetical protein
MAVVAISTRLVAPSLPLMFATWTAAVLLLMKSARLAVGPAGRHQLEHLTLARRQTVAPRVPGPDGGLDGVRGHQLIDRKRQGLIQGHRLARGRCRLPGASGQRPKIAIAGALEDAQIVAGRPVERAGTSAIDGRPECDRLFMLRSSAQPVGSRLQGAEAHPDRCKVSCLA